MIVPKNIQFFLFIYKIPYSSNFIIQNNYFQVTFTLILALLLSDRSIEPLPPARKNVISPLFLFSSLFRINSTIGLFLFLVSLGLTDGH